MAKDGARCEVAKEIFKDVQDNKEVLKREERAG
jgi:hypothetical protein